MLILYAGDGQNCVIKTLTQGRDPQTPLCELSLTRNGEVGWGGIRAKWQQGRGVATVTLVRLKTWENLAANLDLSFPAPSPFSCLPLRGTE